MTSTDLAPSAPDGGVALESLLGRSVVHQKAGAPIPRKLLRYGLYGAIALVAAGILALVLPSTDSIAHSKFFLIFGAQAASIQPVMHAAAIPLIACGAALLGLNLYLMHGRRSEHWRNVVVAQAAAGAVGSLPGVLFLLVAIVNLVIWITVGIAIMTALALAIVVWLNDQ